MKNIFNSEVIDIVKGNLYKAVFSSQRGENFTPIMGVCNK